MSSVTTFSADVSSRPSVKPNAPARKEGTKPRRKDFSAANSNPETGEFGIPFAYKNVGPKRLHLPPPDHHSSNKGWDDLWCSLGFIERIDIKYRKDGNKCVFIHFAPGRWNDNDKPWDLIVMKAGTPLKVVTDEDGHFWKTIISKSQRPADYFEDEIWDGTSSNNSIPPEKLLRWMTPCINK